MENKLKKWINRSDNRTHKNCRKNKYSVILLTNSNRKKNSHLRSSKIPAHAPPPSPPPASHTLTGPAWDTSTHRARLHMHVYPMTPNTATHSHYTVNPKREK